MEKYQVHVILYHVLYDSDGDMTEAKLLEEEEVKGLKDEYESYEEAYVDFLKVRKYTHNKVGGDK